MEFKGTEGNWFKEKEFSKRYEQYTFNINDENNTVIGLSIVYSGTDDDTCREFREAEANAKLIAAAPELLKAVHYLLNAEDDGTWNKQAAESFAREAINKALK